MIIIIKDFRKFFAFKKLYKSQFSKITKIYLLKFIYAYFYDNNNNNN